MTSLSHCITSLQDYIRLLQVLQANQERPIPVQLVTIVSQAPQSCSSGYTHVLNKFLAGAQIIEIAKPNLGVLKE